jgi:hypothetical protein
MAIWGHTKLSQGAHCPQCAQPAETFHFVGDFGAEWEYLCSDCALRMLRQSARFIVELADEGVRRRGTFSNADLEAAMGGAVRQRETFALEPMMC